VAGAAMTLTPHVFVEIRRYHRLRRAEHFLEPSLHGVPVLLDVICADVGLWVAEMFAVVDCLMHIVEAGELSVGSPLV